MIKTHLIQNQEIHRIGFVNYYRFATEAIYLAKNRSFVAKVNPKKVGVFEICNARLNRKIITLLTSELYFYKEEKVVQNNNQTITINAWEIPFPSLVIQNQSDIKDRKESVRFSILWDTQINDCYLFNNHNNTANKVTDEYINEQLILLDDAVFEPMLENSRNLSKQKFAIIENWF